jgi:hypothetical protein
MKKEFYNGWLVEFISEPAGYSYQCWLPGDRVAVSDRNLYVTLESVRNAAHKRADLESVKWALKHCYTNYIQGNLSADEYTTLEGLITGVLTPIREGRLIPQS